MKVRMQDGRGIPLVQTVIRNINNRITGGRDGKTFRQEPIRIRNVSQGAGRDRNNVAAYVRDEVTSQNLTLDFIEFSRRNPGLNIDNVRTIRQRYQLPGANLERDSGERGIRFAFQINPAGLSANEVERLLQPWRVIDLNGDVDKLV